MSLELISFDLCPFVQRSVITLLEKKVDFDITYIDLANPPQWFLEISPFGKVPLLKAETEVIFESAVINEYVDEITPPMLMPEKPMTKALNRAWIEFASELLGLQYQLSIAENETIFENCESNLLINLNKLETQLNNSNFFNGEKISLVDTAFAPLFLRFDILFKHMSDEIYDDKPKISQWSQILLNRDSVVQSVKPDFEEKFLQYIKENSAFMTTKLSL